MELEGFLFRQDLRAEKISQVGNMFEMIQHRISLDSEMNEMNEKNFDIRRILKEQGHSTSLHILVDSDKVCIQEVMHLHILGPHKESCTRIVDKAGDCSDKVDPLPKKLLVCLRVLL
jgi:hypothetical protein